MRPLLTIVDQLADAMLAPSYLRFGYRVRRRLWADPDLEVDLSGRTALVTGANSGLGFVAARELARRGARVLLGCRDAQRAEAARAAVAEVAGEERVRVELVDVSSLRSVRALVERLRRDLDRLDLLVNNAGVLPLRPARSEGGHEITFATNVLGGWVLTRDLLPLLEAAPEGRVVHVTSGGMYTQRLDVAALLEPPEQPFDGVVAYARTKRAQVVLSEQWAERLRERGVTSNCMHPGWADTPGVERSLPRFHRLLGSMLRSPEEGADTLVWLGASPEPAGRSGELFFDRRARRTHVLPGTRETPEERAKLWAALERAAG